MKYKKYFSITVVTAVLLFLNILHAYAQFTPPDDPPCDPDDTQCPLDTGVVVLVLIALIFTTLHLYRKQKTTAQTV